MEDSPLVLHPIPKRQVLTLVHDLLRRHDRYLAIPRNRLSSLQTPLEQLVPSRESPRCNTPLPSLLASEVLPCQDQLHGPGLADGPGQPLAPARARDCPQLDLGLAE